jgi:hypothetical protein
LLFCYYSVSLLCWKVIMNRSERWKQWKACLNLYYSIHLHQKNYILLLYLSRNVAVFLEFYRFLWLHIFDKVCFYNFWLKFQQALMLVYNKFATLHKFILWTWNALLLYSTHFVFFIYLFVDYLMTLFIARLYTIEWTDVTRWYRKVPGLLLL